MPDKIRVLIADDRPRSRDGLRALAAAWPAVEIMGEAGEFKRYDIQDGLGIAAGLHTYAFFIAKDCPWVTPVPDPARRAPCAVFRLSPGRSRRA